MSGRTVRKRERKSFSQICNLWNQTAAERAGALKLGPWQRENHVAQKPNAAAMLSGTLYDVRLSSTPGPSMSEIQKESRFAEQKGLSTKPRSQLSNVLPTSIEDLPRKKDHDSREEECARALAGLSLSVKVLLRMSLPIPPQTAATQIQSIWRGFSTRKVLPVFVAHAHRICMLVERHRKRCLSREGISEELLGKNVLGFTKLEQYQNPFNQHELKGKLRLLWSSKRLSLPVPSELRKDVPYRSAAIDIQICICFVTNFISFHVGQRARGRDQGNRLSASSILILQRLNAIVEKDHDLLIRKLQACFRGWSVRKQLFGTYSPVVSSTKGCIRDAIRRRSAGLIILRSLRKMIWAVQWMKIKPIIVQLIDIAKSEKSFYMSLDKLYRTAWIPLEKRALTKLERDTSRHASELDKISAPRFPHVTPRDLAVIFGNLVELRKIVLHQLNAIAACFDAIPHLGFERILQTHEKLLVALSQYISNFPQAMVRQFEFRQHHAFEFWVTGLEESIGNHLISHFMGTLLTKEI
mmetsp:Transcript_24876/g.56150  ORF Transcript_24876/g.56150 Transcript_24876/m.56150 type:complete len:525 (-) Transcript_24876:884-2458(-)